MNYFYRFMLCLLLLVLGTTNHMAAAWAQASTGVIRGRILDAATKSPIVGANIIIEGTQRGVASDAQGEFLLADVPAGECRVEISYITYKTFHSEPLQIKADQSTVLDVSLVEDVSELENVVVVATRKTGTEAGLIAQMRSLALVANGVSAQAIARSQDRDASEVVKRIPGISIIEEKFVLVRGLAQRYNNVWINGAAVPSSEADTRAFSFDIIPSSQMESLMIVKSPMAELPADFSGGFIQIRTKLIPESNSTQISYGTGFNSRTHSNDFLYNPASSTDWLGFDDGKRALKGLPTRLSNDNSSQIDRATKSGFNNDWTVKSRQPLWDQKVNLSLNRRFESQRGARVGLVSAINYSNTSKSFLDMTNAQFGIYNREEDQSQYNFKYVDNQYTQDVKLGAMLNLSYLPVTRGGVTSKYELRNIFNQLGRNRYTLREGWRNVSGYYEQQQEEYLYTSRSSYTGQVAGDHRWTRTHLDWNGAYSYSNRNQPDRRIVQRQKDPDDGVYEYAIDQASVSRYYTALDEHLFSGGANLSHPLNSGGTFAPELRVGLYGEYKTRTYDTRNFLYKWDAYNNTLPGDFAQLSSSDIFTSAHLGSPDKLHVQEETRNTDNYSATNYTQAAYVALNLPLGSRASIYAGARLENFTTSLTSYTQLTSFKTKTEDYSYLNVLPSINATYNLNPTSLLRLAYGMSVNRPEFRELSPSTYYDFDMFSTITGNPSLKQATVQNIDLRYEIYPSSGELISVSLFYKHFKNPIEWTYVDAGGSYQFSFENAQAANNYGVEVEIKKELTGLGMKNFTAAVNASWIESQVLFGRNSMEHDRPMQGQSPYLINAGLFYQHPTWGLSLGAIYNRIGKRIVGIGRISTSGGDNLNNNIPDMYELARNTLDFTFTKRLYKGLELRGAVKDILADRVEFVQYPQFTDAAGKINRRTQTTKSYLPGRTFQLSLVATF